MKLSFPFLIAFCSVASLSAHAQGWVGAGSGTLYPVTNTLKTTPVLIGIGTNAPSAQLHTTGTVRFQGIGANNTLNRILALDSNGNVYARDAASFGGGTTTAGSWLLKGNSGTVPGTNFIGTTDNNRLVFKTNNIEQVTILPTGNVGLGTTSPRFKLHVHKSTPDATFGLSGAAPSLRFWGGTSATTPTYQAIIGLATATNNYSQGTVAGDMVIGPNGDKALIINGDPYGTEKMRVSGNGNVGIGTAAPTARLHVNGGVRFENIPAGAGTPLVIDANGTIFRQSATFSTASTSLAGGTSSSEVDLLRAELAELKKQVVELQQLVGTKTPRTELGTSSLPRLSESVPNPSSDAATISYFIPASFANQPAVLNIADRNGRMVKRFVLDSKVASGQVVVRDLGVASDIFIYSLEVGGKTFDSKKMTRITN